MGDENAAGCVEGNLLELAPKVIKVAEKRKLQNDNARKLLQLCQPPKEDENELTAGMFY